MSPGLFVASLLGISVFHVASFPSTIHEKMTPEEIFDVFGATEDSIPDYEIFPVSLPSSRRKRNANAELKMSLELGDRAFNLKFKPSKGNVARKFTPVWSAISDEKAYKKVRYEPLANAMTDIGNFRMYHDMNNDAAIVVWNDHDQGPIVEGVVTSLYAIKTLPKRLIGEIHKLGEHVVEIPLVKRSIDESDANEDINYLAVFKITAPQNHAKRDSTSKHRATRTLSRTKDRFTKPYAVDTVYPEFLVVLDHNAIRKRTITQALRFLLTFWNGVHMVYSKLSGPKVRVNIAGVIISADDAATPYIAPSTDIKTLGPAGGVLDRMGPYFYKEEMRFPFDIYDSVMAMTTIDLCSNSVASCVGLLGIARLEGACTRIDEVDKIRSIDGASLVHYNWDYGGINTAIHEAAHLNRMTRGLSANFEQKAQYCWVKGWNPKFSADHDQGDGNLDTDDCDSEAGYAMAAAAIYRDKKFKWSRCSIRDLGRYFRRGTSECLDNPPVWMEEFDEVLPGRWLSIDGQCRNEGYLKGCRIPKVPICLAKGCVARDTKKCVGSELATLAGSTCGNNTYCNPQGSCVAK